MESFILQALPSMHGALIGMAVALITAFSVYAYQKLQEAKDQLDQAILGAAELGRSGGFFKQDADIYDANGELDWDEKCKNLLMEARSIYFHLDIEAHGFKMPGGSANSHSDVVALCRCLLELLSVFFLKYPFPNPSQCTCEDGSEFKASYFDFERLKEMDRRIGFVSWIWQTGSQSMLALAHAAEEEDRAHRARRERENFDANMARMPCTDEQKKELWLRHHQPRIDQVINYEGMIRENFQKVIYYEREVIPKLTSLLRMHHMMHERFQIKKNLLAAHGVVSFVFVFGVLVPLVLVDMSSMLSLSWAAWFPYFMLVVTTLPYFQILIDMRKKIRAGLGIT